MSHINLGSIGFVMGLIPTEMVKEDQISYTIEEANGKIIVNLHQIDGIPLVLVMKRNNPLNSSEANVALITYLKIFFVE